MPSQAESSPAKSGRSSSSRTGDTSCVDRTGERWVPPSVGASRRPRLSLVQSSPNCSGPCPHQQLLRELGTHHLHKAGDRTRLGERGKSGSFLGGIPGRETIPSALVSLCIAIGHFLISFLRVLRCDSKAVQFALLFLGALFTFKMFHYFNIDSV